MLEDFKNFINEMCDNSLIDDNIIYESQPKELRWTWINERTKQEWSLKVSQLKTYLYSNKSDKNNPTNKLIANFLAGKRNPFEVKIELEKLEKVVAFW